MTWNPMGQKFDPEPVTLSGFLLARIAEDEALAREVLAADQVLRDAGTEPMINAWHQAAVRHFLRWQPVAVLDECEAKRRIVVELHKTTTAVERWNEHLRSMPPFGCVICHENDGVYMPGGYCDTIRALALPYAGHPHYREEWRPPVS